MKFFIVISFLIVIIHLVNAKDIGKKNVTKKATSKKVSKTVIEEFKELPPEDMKFIKELDKQFKMHGDNVHIKIEKESITTNSSKNSKRTIDGELGYGLYNNDLGNGYQFSEPKFMIYPYSQEDIPPVRQYQQHQKYHGSRHNIAAQYQAPPPHHQIQQNPNVHTSVLVQPSNAFELKEIHENYGGGYNQQQQQYPDAIAYQHHPQQQQQQQVVQQEEQPQQIISEPVIVLRIPGPTKYAQHLQSLLQQYLEIRAAQYIQQLQAQEAQGHNIEHIAEQQNIPEPQQQYVHVLSHSPGELNNENNGQQAYSVGQAQSSQIVYEDHSQVAPTHQNSEDIQQQQQQQQPEQIVYQYEQQTYQQQSNDGGYQNSDQIVPQPHIVYGPVSPSSPPQHVTEASHLSTLENFPRNTHTQAIFPSTQTPTQYDQIHQQLQLQQEQEQQHQQQQLQHQQQQQQQLIQTHQNYQQQIQIQNQPDISYGIENTYNQHEEYQAPLPQAFQQSQHQQNLFYPPPSSPEEEYQSASEKTISITQRSPTPYDNYRSHSSTILPVSTLDSQHQQQQHQQQQQQQQQQPKTSSSLGTHDPKRQTPFTEVQFKKFNKLINRLKKKSTVREVRKNE